MKALSDAHGYACCCAVVPCPGEQCPQCTADFAVVTLSGLRTTFQSSQDPLCDGPMGFSWAVPRDTSGGPDFCQWFWEEPTPQTPTIILCFNPQDGDAVYISRIIVWCQAFVTPKRWRVTIQINKHPVGGGQGTQVGFLFYDMIAGSELCPDGTYTLAFIPANFQGTVITGGEIGVVSA